MSSEVLQEDRSPKSSTDEQLAQLWNHQQRSFAGQRPEEILGLPLESLQGGARSHQFWSRQPVPQALEAERAVTGPIEAAKVEIPITPALLPSPDFEWANFSFPHTDNPLQSKNLAEVHSLLKDHYVENVASTLRFLYTMEFLHWALFPPNYIPDWYAGIYRRDTRELIAFISALPVELRVGSQIFRKPQEIGEINFLCIHKAYRKKKLAELLIAEITRRVNQSGVFQALYTSGNVLPTPFARAQYFHRSLNVSKLLRVGFMDMPDAFARFRNPKGMLERYYAVPTFPPSTAGHRAMRPDDVPRVRALLNRYYSENFAVAPRWGSDAEVAHWFVPRKEVVYSYVMESLSSGGGREITDFFSFYLLPSSSLDSSAERINAAYCFYFAANSVSQTDLLQRSLACANAEGFDVYNTLNILGFEKEELLRLKFNEGDGFLNYYLFNYRFPAIPPKLIGVVML